MTDSLNDLTAVLEQETVIASQKRIDANRNNARKSTGPKSARGKTMSRFNALKFGAFATQTLLPGEDRHEHKKLVRRLTDELRPQTTVETMLVDQIIGDLWRLRRIEAASRAYLENVQDSAYARLLRSLPHNELAHVKSSSADVPGKQAPLSSFAGLRAAGGIQPSNSCDTGNVCDARYGPLDAALSRLKDPATTFLDAIVSPTQQSPYAVLESTREKLAWSVLHKHTKLCELQHMREFDAANRRAFLRQMPISPSRRGDSEDGTGWPAS